MISSLVCVAVYMCIFTGVVFAREDTVADFNSGDDTSVYWGAGTTWAGPFNNIDGIAASKEYSSTVWHSLESGYSLNIIWSGVDASTEYIVGVITDMDNDISSFNVLSFWIYTPNAGTNIGVSIMDTGYNSSQVQLRDYLTTGTSTWENVSIPVSAFTRENHNMDITHIKEIQWTAFNERSHDESGSIYIDNVKFAFEEHAPEASIIYSGGDKGAVNLDDTSGDVLLWWEQAMSTVTSNIVSVSVQAGYSIDWISLPQDSTAAADSTVYFPYSLLNLGNSVDDIQLSTDIVSGEAWPLDIILDKNENGIYDTDIDTVCWNSLGTLPGSTYYFLVGITVPADSVNASSITVKITARDNNGSGINDLWPGISDDDTITDNLTLMCYLPTINSPGFFTGTALSTASIRWDWVDNSDNEDGFEIHTATSGVIVSTGVLISGTTYWIQSGLSANTSSFADRIYAVNESSYSLAAGAQVSPVYTLAAEPSNLQAVSVFISSVTISWDIQDNPFSTRYGVSLSTDSFITHVSSSAEFNDGLTENTTSITGLASDTSYYFRVWAFNGNGISSGLSNIITIMTETSIGSSPDDFSGTALSSTAIIWSWTDNSSLEDGYRIKTDTGGIVIDTGAPLTGGTTAWVEYGLLANTSYYRAVEVYNSSGSSMTVVTSRYTLAQEPVSMNFAGVFSSSVTLEWTVPSGATSYGIAKSTDNFTVNIDTLTVFSDNMQDLSNTVAGLEANATYWFRIWSYNGDGVGSGYISGSTKTLTSQTEATITFDKENYYTLVSSALITIDDQDMNTSPLLKEIVVSSITSTSDPSGIIFTLEETGIDTGVFISTTNLIFSTSTSVSGQEIKITDGDTLTAIYRDIRPGGQKTAVSKYYAMSRESGSIIIQQNAPGTSDIITGIASSVNANQTIFLFSASGAVLSQFTVISDAQGRFSIDIGSNYIPPGSTIDENTGEVVFYIGTGDTGSANRIEIRNDVKCIVKEAKIRIETSLWGEAPDYIVGDHGATESSAEVSLSPAYQCGAGVSAEINGRSFSINSNGSFRIPLGNKYQKYSLVSMNVTDSAYNTATVMKSALPGDYDLLQSAPNPFKVDRDKFVAINYWLPEDSDVKLEIYNIAGELVKILVDEQKQAGRYAVKWYGDNGAPGDNTGQAVGSGVYIYVLEAEGYTGSKKLILVR